jgi:hypothetical protein
MKQKDEKVTQWEFQGQGKFPIAGANACTAIAIAMVARMAKMENGEFFQTFGPQSSIKRDTQEIASQILSAVVQTGVDINTKISSGFFSRLKKKDAMQIKTGLAALKKAADKNIGATQDVACLEELVLLKGQSTIDEIFQGSTTNNIKTHQKHALTVDELCFIATTKGHTTAILSRTDDTGKQHYINIDSATGFLNLTGTMEVHPSFESLKKSLETKWGKADQVDITVYTTNRSLVKELNDPPQAAQSSMTM